MKHPNPLIQKKQDEFLNNWPDGEREYHARIFRIGNASIHYPLGKPFFIFSATHKAEYLSLFSCRRKDFISFYPFC